MLRCRRFCPVCSRRGWLSLTKLQRNGDRVRGRERGRKREGDRKSCEQRWRVEPYMGSHLKCIRTCLQSLITSSFSHVLTLPPSFSPSSLSIHPSTHHSVHSILTPLLTLMSTDTCTHTYSTLSNHLPKVFLRNDLATPLTQSSTMADLLIWVTEDQTGEREREQSAGPVSTFNHVSMDKSPAGMQHFKLRAFKDVYIKGWESEMQSRQRENVSVVMSKN